MKKNISIFLIISLVIFSIVPTMYANSDNDNVKFNSNDYSNLVNNYFELFLNCNNSLISILSSNIKADHQNFISNHANIENNIGMFNILEYGEIEIINQNLDNVLNKYELLVKVNLNVVNENNYFINGINYFKVVIVKEDGVLKIDEFSIPDIEYINTYEPNKSDCDIYLSNRLRVFGSKIGMYSYDDAVSSFVNLNPTSIKVLITATNNIQTVNFKQYCKVVLANEVYSSWNSEALKACGLAVKQYGWHLIISPKYPSLGYDVKDSTADQKYDPSKTIPSSISTAIDNIYNYVVVNNNGHHIFTSYHAGISGQYDHPGVAYVKYHGGRLSQYGSQKIATEGGNFKNILHYYYDYSEYPAVSPNGSIKILCTQDTSHVFSGSYGYNEYLHWSNPCSKCEYHTSPVQAHSWIPSGVGFRCTVCNYYTKYAVVVPDSMKK